MAGEAGFGGEDRAHPAEGCLAAFLHDLGDLHGFGIDAGIQQEAHLLHLLALPVIGGVGGVADGEGGAAEIELGFVAELLAPAGNTVCVGEPDGDGIFRAFEARTDVARHFLVERQGGLTRGAYVGGGGLFGFRRAGGKREEREACAPEPGHACQLAFSLNLKVVASASDSASHGRR